MFLGSSLADVKLNMKYLFLHLFLGFGFFYFLFLFFTYANHRWRKTLQIHFFLMEVLCVASAANLAY